MTSFMPYLPNLLTLPTVINIFLMLNMSILRESRLRGNGLVIYLCLALRSLLRARHLQSSIIASVHLTLQG